MDPVTAVATVVSLLDVSLRTTSALIGFAQDAQNASTDRTLLAEECLSLSRLLERLRDRAQNAQIDNHWIEERKDLLRQFQRAYDDLAKLLKVDITTGKLKQESRFKAIRTSTKWSFTKSDVYLLLERVTRLQQHANTLLLDDQHTILEQISRQQQEGVTKKQKSAILTWLSPLQMAQVHQTISDRTEEGSGIWFLTCEKFAHWETRTQRLLWCSGIPGAGKTVLVSIAVNHLRRKRTELEENKQSNVGIAFLYLKYSDPDQTLTNLFGSLLKQLIEDQEAVPDSLQALYDRHYHHKTSPSLNETAKVLKIVIAAYTKVFLVIDALDECSEETRWALLDQLRDIADNVHIMVTSRLLESIQEELEDFEQLEIKAHKSDIELFIDRQIRKNRNLRRIVQKKPTLREDIKEGVVNTAENMFLLAQLHVDALANAAALSIRHVRDKLKSLPTTLSGTYDEAMQRIYNQDTDRKEVALKTLAWVSYAFRSLSLREIQHAVAIRPGDTDLDEDLVMDGSSITAVCAGLIVVDQRSGIVTLVHYTAKHCFEQIRSVSFPDFHASITMSCATYLTLGALKDATIWEILRNFPLAGYAAQYMGEHARQNPEDTLEPSILETISHLLSHPGKRRPLLALLDSLDMINCGFYSSNEAASSYLDYATSDESTELRLGSLLESLTEVADDMSQAATETGEGEVGLQEEQVEVSHLPEVTALHLAASMGLAKVAAMLLKETPNIDAVDENGNTALAVAIERGFEKAVEFLVISGACVDLGHQHGREIFLLVTERDWNTAAESIANKARAVVLENELSRVPLLLASYYGDNTSMRNLLKQPNINLQTEDRDLGIIALFVAVERGHLEIMDILLSAGVSVDSRDSAGCTLLHRATRRKNEAMLRLLLRNNAAVDAKNDGGLTAFSANFRTCGDSCARILLDAGADPDTVSHDGVSELYEVAAKGEVQHVKLLLKYGTNPSIRTKYGWTPLHWAANGGHTEVVKILIQAGADLSPISDQTVTPLDMAIRSKHSATVDLLVQTGARESRDVLAESNATKQVKALADVLDIFSVPEPNLTELSQPPDKIFLVFDKPLGQRMAFGQFVYASNFPGNLDYFYHISYPLDTATTSISIRRTKRRADITDYPIGLEMFFRTNVLYEVERTTLDYQDLELRAVAPDAPYKEARMQRGWVGSWKICHEHTGTSELLFRTTPDWSKTHDEGCRWIMDDGILLARSGFNVVNIGVGNAIPTLTLEPGLGLPMQDLLVACWIAKLWSDIVRVQTPKA